METPTLSLAFIAGLLSFVSPCVLPLVPAYIGYMGGRMANTISAQVALVGVGGTSVTRASVASRFSILLHGLFFVAGFTLVFVVVGVVVTVALGPVRDIIGRIGGVVIIFFGLHFMGLLPKLFNRLLANPQPLNNPFVSLVMALLGTALLVWGFTGVLAPSLVATNFAGQSEVMAGTVVALILVAVYLLWLFIGGAFTRPGNFWVNIITGLQTALYTDTRKQIAATGRQGYLGSSIMGVVFAAGWTPCIGPILGSILGLAATGNSVASSASLLVSYSLGLGIPFLLAAGLLDSAQGLLRRLQRHMHKIELVTGGFLVVIGVAVASGQLQAFSQQATIQFGDFSVRVEECGVAFFEGEIPASYLGSCVSGETRLLAIGNTVQNKLGAGSQSQHYIFRAEEGRSLTIEMRDRNSTFQPVLILLDEQNNELARAEMSISGEDGNIAVIENWVAPSNQVYTLIASHFDSNYVTVEGPFTIRVSESKGDSASTPALNSISQTAAETTAPVTGLEIGNAAPNFTTMTAAGEATRLSDWRGQVVLLNFWATWCGPCRVEMPEFETAYQSNTSRGFTILAVNNQETVDDVNGFVAELDLSFPMLMDESGATQKLYSVVSYPSTFLIDRQGVIVARQFGPMTADMIEEWVTKALS